MGYYTVLIDKKKKSIKFNSHLNESEIHVTASYWLYSWWMPWVLLRITLGDDHQFLFA